MPRELRRLVGIYVRKAPFCYKDPRFFVTLPVWKRQLPEDTGFIVAFRNPHRTVDSVLRDVSESYDPPLSISSHWAYTSWYRNYRRTLEEFSKTGDWFFADYDQIIEGGSVSALQCFTRAKLTTQHVDAALSRSRPVPRAKGLLAQRCEALYEELRKRAAESAEIWSQKASWGDDPPQPRL